MRCTDPKKTAFIPLCMAVVASVNASLPATAELAAALLPSSRSTEVGNTVTVFSTVINAGSTTATECQIGVVSASQVTLSYQTTDPATNLPTGSANTPVDIAAGGSQSFVLSVTPSEVIDSAEMEFSFSCASGATAGTIAGVNTLLLSASNTPVVDVVALSATAQNNGLLALDDSAGAFALATINLGAADTVSVAADTGDSSLPVTLSVCETNPTTGACLAAPAASVQSAMAAGATPTFSVFSNATGAIANDPASNRVFVRFTDSNSVVRGGTSVAIENQLLAGLPSLSQNTIAVLNRVFLLLFGGGPLSTDGATAQNLSPSAEEPIDQIIPCETGQIIVSGTVDGDENGSSSTVTMTFENCDGLSGVLTAVTTATIDGSTLAFDVLQNGTYSADDCEEITMTDVRTSATVDLFDISEEALGNIELTTSGTISGRCEGQTFSCSLQDIDLQNEASVENSCSN